MDSPYSFMILDCVRRTRGDNADGSGTGEHDIASVRNVDARNAGAGRVAHACSCFVVEHTVSCDSWPGVCGTSNAGSACGGDASVYYIATRE